MVAHTGRNSTRSASLGAYLAHLEYDWAYQEVEVRCDPVPVTTQLHEWCMSLANGIYVRVYEHTKLHAVSAEEEVCEHASNQLDADV